MNVCTICQADGVLEALGVWYCKDHLDDAMYDVGEYVDRVSGSNYLDMMFDNEVEPEPAPRPFWGPPTGPKA